MPTGYTAAVEDGTITDFPTFALRCARAFGALVEMRDERLDAPIPDQITSSPYYTEALAEARKKLKRLQALTPSEQATQAEAAYQRAVEEETRAHEADRVRLTRYNAMLAQVVEWTPPTPDHKDLKRFMIEQINESKRYIGGVVREPERQTPAQWYAKELAGAEKGVAYYLDAIEKENARAAERTAWVKALRESLMKVAVK